MPILVLRSRSAFSSGPLIKSESRSLKPWILSRKPRLKPLLPPAAEDAEIAVEAEAAGDVELAPASILTIPRWQTSMRNPLAADAAVVVVAVVAMLLLPSRRIR